MQIDRNDDLFWRNSKLFGRGIDDAPVGWVRDKPIEIAGARSGCLKGLRDNIGHHADGMAEHFSSRHPQMPGGLGRRRPAIDKELVAVAAVRTKLRGKNTAIMRG